MANGRVITGFSLPYVATYANSGTTVTYSNGMALARGVSVALSVDAASDNIFYADNQEAENLSGTFSGGTATLTVDGLKNAAAQLILGLPSADEDGWIAYGDDQSIPYVGVGFIVRYMENSTTTYVPIVLPKVMFAIPGVDAATQEAEIDWQTQELTASIYRDDTSSRNWKYVGEAQSTESEAYALITAKLGA